jgi:hypothetical protein
MVDTDRLDYDYDYDIGIDYGHDTASAVAKHPITHHHLH